MKQSLILLLCLTIVSCATPEKLNKSFIKNIKSGGEVNISQFIEKGGNINHHDDDGKSAIHYAVEENDTALIESLITAGANINIKDFKSNTPLILAVKDEYLASTDVLIENKANLEIEDRKKHSALYYAIKANNVEITNTLLNANANIKRDDIFSYITGKVTPEIIISLKTNGLETNSVTETKNSLLHHAIFNRNQAIIDHLISTDIDINLQNDSGNTVFHEDINYETAKVLIYSGAQLDIQNNVGNTVFHTYNNNCEILNLLLANSDDINNHVNIVNNAKDSPLHLAKNEKCINLLIAANANPNTKNLLGFNTAYNSDTAKITLLLMAGVNINEIHDDSGDSIFSYLVKIHFSEANYLQRIIETYNPNINHANKLNIRPLSYIALSNAFWFTDNQKSESLSILIKNGAEVNYFDDISGYTPLHYTAKLVNYQATKILLESDANPIALSVKGNNTADILAINAIGANFSDRQKLSKLIKSYQKEKY